MITAVAAPKSRPAGPPLPWLKPAVFTGSVVPFVAIA